MRYLVCFYSVAVFLCACKKSEHPVRKIVVVNVVNAITNIPAVKIDQTRGTASFSSLPELLSYGGGNLYYYEAGKCSFSVLTEPDSLKILDMELSLNASMNSMFIFGEAQKPDTLFFQELDFPIVKTDVTSPVAADSVIYVRFVNLSTNSPTLKITLAASPEVSELSNFNYKDVTEFKPYSVRPGNPTRLVFQIRDNLTNSLLASTTLNVTATNRFKCVAVVIRGKVGSDAPYDFRASVINYF